MMSERKAFRLTWFARIVMLFGIFGLLFAGYMSAFVNSDTMQSYAIITVAFFMGMLFFSTFPGYRIDIRLNQIKKRFSENPVFNNTSTLETTVKNDIRQLIKFIIKVSIWVVFVVINILLAIRAYSNSNQPAMFLHMVFLVAAAFVFNAFLLIYKVDETFMELENLISKLKKDKTAEEKSK